MVGQKFKKEHLMNAFHKVKKFTSEGGRILAARITGLSTKLQRKITREIKIARMIALMPFVSKFD